jgi:hypothetical protein
MQKNVGAREVLEDAFMFAASRFLIGFVTFAVVFFLGLLFACEPMPATERDTQPFTRPDATSDAQKSDGGADDDDDDGDAAPKTQGVTCNKGVSFSKDILLTLSKAGCASVACHGSRLGHAPRLETKDSDLTYKDLTMLKVADKPYVKAGATDPTDSAIYCHLRQQCGKKMPPAGGEIPKELLVAVEGWLACGAPKN